MSEWHKDVIDIYQDELNKMSQNKVCELVRSMKESEIIVMD